MKKKLKVPTSKENTIGVETVSGAPNHGAVKDGQPIGSSEFTAPGNEGLPESILGGHTRHEQFVPAEGANPVRMRINKPEGGSHTTSETRPTPPKPHDVQDRAKMELFKRGGSGTSDKIPRPGMSGRDFNSNDVPAPNTARK